MIQINFTCDKDWDNMSPNGEGRRFCESCRKSVSDYTDVSKPKNIKGCGRFNLSQVSKIKRQLSIPALSVYTASLLTVLGVTAADIKTLKAQESQTISQADKKSSKTKITGIIREMDSKEPLPFVQIEILDSAKNVISEFVSGFDGDFTIEFDLSNNFLEDISLVFKYVGYLNDTIKIEDVKNLNTEMVINLHLDNQLSDSIIIKDYVLTGLVDEREHKLKFK